MSLKGFFLNCYSTTVCCLLTQRMNRNNEIFLSIYRTENIKDEINF